MSGGPLVPSTAQGTQETTSPKYEVPLGTQQRFNEVSAKFGKLLAERAISHMQSRNSGTLADTDVDDAYRELTRPSKTSKLNKCLGDGALFVGGILVPLAFTLHWAFAPVGFVVAGLGLYVREFGGEP